MEMTPAYMRQLTEFLASRGFACTESDVLYGPVDEPETRTGHRYALVRGEHERFVFEVVEHPRDAARYFIEIERYHGLRAHAFALESWKVHPARIEFKLGGETDSLLAFAFVIDLPA